MIQLKEINAVLLLQWLVRDLWKIIGFGVVFSIIAVVYALSLPNEYTSSTVTASNISQGNKASSALGGLGGFASMAGINLGSSDTYSPEVLREMLMSTNLLASFAKEKGIVAEVAATEGYDFRQEKFIYKDDMYDAASATWVREVDYPATAEPSASEIAHEIRKKFSANYDRKTKLINVSYTSFSPAFSQQFVTEIVAYLNDYIREREMLASQSTIGYIEEILGQSSAIEVKTALQAILEEQYKQLTFAQTRPDYALMTVDPAVLPFQKSGPNRPLICLLIAGFGVVFCTLILWTVRIFRS